MLPTRWKACVQNWTLVQFMYCGRGCCIACYDSINMYNVIVQLLSVLKLRRHFLCDSEKHELYLWHGLKNVVKKKYLNLFSSGFEYILLRDISRFSLLVFT